MYECHPGPNRQSTLIEINKVDNKVGVNLIDFNKVDCFNPAAAGPPRHAPAAGGGGHKVAPLYFCEDIVATRRDREAKRCTHLSEYLAEVVSKFGVDPI